VPPNDTQTLPCDRRAGLAFTLMNLNCLKVRPQGDCSFGEPPAFANGRAVTGPSVSEKFQRGGRELTIFGELLVEVEIPKFADAVRSSGSSLPTPFTPLERGE